MPPKKSKKRQYTANKTLGHHDGRDSSSDESQKYEDHIPKTNSLVDTNCSKISEETTGSSSNGDCANLKDTLENASPTSKLNASTIKPDSTFCTVTEEGKMRQKTTSSVEESQSTGDKDDSGSAVERLMRNIDLFVRDSEFIPTCRPKVDYDSASFRHTNSIRVSDNDSCTTWSHTAAIVSETLDKDVSSCEDIDISCRNNYTDSEINQIANNSQPSVEVSGSITNVTIIVDNDGNLGEIQALLLRLKEILCCHDLCANKFKQDRSSLILTGNENEDVDVNLSLLAEDNLQNYSKEHIQEHVNQLMNIVLHVLDIKQFSSVEDIRKYLEVVEIAMTELRQEKWHHLLQFVTETGSQRIIDSLTTELSDKNAILFLSHRFHITFTELSEKLIVWQDFSEYLAELEHELNQEHHCLAEIESRVNSSNCDSVVLESVHDLDLLEEKLEEYDSKLRNLRKCNHDLATVVDDDALTFNRSRTGILSNMLHVIKDSCINLRKKLDSDPDSNEMPSSSEETLDKQNLCSLSHIQTENFTNSSKPQATVCCCLLKMAFLLFLFALLFFVICFIDPRCCRLFQHFRFPVPFHLRHVGTTPTV